MGKIACVFPGQGCQSVGMGLDLFNTYSGARKIFELVDVHCRTSLSKIIFEGPEWMLKRTIYTQPAILAVSLGAWDAYMQEGGPEPEFVAGHSLGEYTALVAAGVLSPEDAIKLVAQRARLMENCPPGAMTAVIGLDVQSVEESCRQVSQDLQAASGKEIVVVANFNSNEQITISGSLDAVQRASELLKAKGGKVIPLPVGGAFHSPLMSSAAEEFAGYIEAAHFANAAYPVIQNYDACPAQVGAEIKSKLTKQIENPVRWSQSIQYMVSEGVDTFVEIGPGKVLTGLVKKLAKGVHIFNVSDVRTLRSTIEQLSDGVSRQTGT